MRISDWSSDVCSSDLLRVEAQLPAGVFLLARGIFGPQRAGADRLFGGDQRRGEALRVRAFELVVDAEGDGDVDFELADRQRGVEQRGETGEMALDLAVLIIGDERSEEHTSELQSLMRISYAVFCLTKKITQQTTAQNTHS